MSKFDDLKAKVAEIEADAEKFYTNSVAAAGTRLRKGMLDLKALAQDIREEVSSIKNSK